MPYTYVIACYISHLKYSDAALFTVRLTFYCATQFQNVMQTNFFVTSHEREQNKIK